MGKVYHGMEKTDRVDMVSYTKHYYAGSERVSAKTGTLRVIGSFPQVLLASEMPNLNITAVRAASTASVTDAGAIVTGVYNKFGMTPPPLAPTVENNRTESFHDPARLTISYFHPDHLGSSSYITNASGNVTQHLEYMAFGEVFVEEHSNSLNSPFKFNGKELDGETGNYYYGARYYDPKLSIFTSVDPLAEKTGDAYGYCYNNPVNLVDPTGMAGENPPSTHTDKDGNIIAVYNDGDLGVYKHGDNADKKTPTKANIDKRHEKSTSAGGKKMGETEFWNEFIAPGDLSGTGHIIYDPENDRSNEFSMYKGTNWDEIITTENKRANRQDLLITMNQSKRHGSLDIKNNINFAYYGPMTGRLLNGKFATARSAGNFLAGLNGVTGTLQGCHISGLTYMKLAGAYQALGELSKPTALIILITGKSYGPAPYYGEQEYSGRRIIQGINYGTRK